VEASCENGSGRDVSGDEHETPNANRRERISMKRKQVLNKDHQRKPDRFLLRPPQFRFRRGLLLLVPGRARALSRSLCVHRRPGAPAAPGRAGGPLGEEIRRPGDVPDDLFQGRL